MRFVLREVVTAALLVGLGGCLFASMRESPAQSATLTAARVQASTAAPCLPLLVLRTARDDLDLPDIDRSNVAMVVDAAELDVRTLDRARAALLEGLARGVERGTLDEPLLSVLVDQMSWAAGEVAPRLERRLEELYDLLSPPLREALIARVETKLPNWSLTWATDRDHRWLESWPSRELPDFSGDLARTSRIWGEKSVADVRVKLPTLDLAQRRALVSSLRTGVRD